MYSNEYAKRYDMENGKKDRPLYGGVKVYDYEHSGDSARAYAILKQHGITKTSFDYQGDGNVATIEFTTEYKDNATCDRLKEELDNAGYGCYYINLWQYQPTDYDARIKEVLPLTKTILEDIVKSVPYQHELEEMDGSWNVVVRLELWRSTIDKKNPDLLTKHIEMFKTLGCKAVRYTYNDVQMCIYGIGNFACVKEHKEELLESGIEILFYRRHKDWREDAYEFLTLSKIRGELIRYGEKYARFGDIRRLLGGV